MKTPIDLFVEALSTTAAEALSRKTSAAWTVTADDKPTPVPAGTQLLTILMVAEPSKAEAAIQISAESALSLAAALSGAAAPPRATPRAAAGGHRKPCARSHVAARQE